MLHRPARVAGGVSNYSDGSAVTGPVGPTQAVPSNVLRRGLLGPAAFRCMFSHLVHTKSTWCVGHPMRRCMPSSKLQSAAACRAACAPLLSLPGSITCQRCMLHQPWPEQFSMILLHFERLLHQPRPLLWRRTTLGRGANYSDHAATLDLACCTPSLVC
jgi:hypothetical protein